MPLLKILPSLISQGSFTGSFSGTSSYARRSLTASYVMGGAAGSSGTSGANGTSGSSGQSGTSGSSGTSGINGTSGSSGTSATAGSSGTSGVGSPGTSGTAGSSGTSSTATVQTGSLAKQIILYNVTSGSQNVITGLNLSGNKWGVDIKEEWDAKSVTGDEYYNSCSLLLHLNGSNGSTTFTDNSPTPKTPTSNNGAAISTAQSKFGGASLFLDGTDDYVTVPDNSGFDFGSGNFTIEYWEYRTSTTSQSPILTRNNVQYTPYLIGWYDAAAGGNVAMYMSSGGVSWDLASNVSMGALTTNVWTHYAVTRQGNTFRTFQNGIQISTFTSAAAFPAGSGALQIGRFFSSYYFKGGYIDELRITKGVARYTSNFTPQTSEFPNNSSLTQYATKYVGLIGGLNDRSVDYGIQKLSDTSLKVVKMTQTTSPFPSGSLSASVDRVYVNVLDYTKVSVTSSYSLLSKTASYALNASGGGSTLRTGSRYPITASRAITASYALNGGTALVNQTMNYVSGSNLYILSRSVVSPSDVLLSVNGIIQTPITDYTVSASRVTFTESYPSGSKINARYLVTATNSSDVNLANIVLTGTTTGDAYYPQVAALLHFDGTNGSTVITDNSKNNLTVTATNGAFISTVQSKFGGASVFLDGTNDYLVSQTTPMLTFGTNDLTVELWIYQTVSSVSAYKALVGDDVYSSVGGWILYSYNNQLNLWKGGTEIISPSGTLTLNSWNHIVWTRASGNNRIFINGTQVGSTVSDSTNYVSSVIYIGASKTNTLNFAGYIDELRITNGYARYTSNFTPPTAAFSNTGGDVGKALVVNSTATGVSIGTAGFNLNSSNINRIINGAMAIDQRNAGASQTITAAAALAYTVDRWYAYCTGANVTGQRVAGTGNNQYAYRFTGAASVTGIGFGQRIEAANSFDLAGSTVTLGVDLANSVLTSVTWTVYYANTSDTFGTLASPTRTQISTGTFTVNSTLSRYSTQIFIPSAATTGIEIVFSVGAQTSGTWTIDNVQLEAGPLATPFERRLVGLELLLCQRYFVSINGSTGPGSEFGTTAAYIKLPLSTWMRADNQTVTLSTGNSISINLFGVGTSTTSTSNVTITANRAGIIFNINTLSPSQGATGTPAEIIGTVSVSSEL
jgi:hypothetical protein